LRKTRQFIAATKIVAESTLNNLQMEPLRYSFLNATGSAMKPEIRAVVVGLIFAAIAFGVILSIAPR
jgi:hypothetical protein